MRLLVVAIAVLIAACSNALGDQLNLQVEGKRLTVDVAMTVQELSDGLTMVTELPPNRGMLFVFPYKDRHCMTGEKMVFPVSIAFLDDQFRIIEVKNMEALNEHYVCATQSVRYAIETNIHWFKRNKIKPPALISILEVDQ